MHFGIEVFQGRIAFKATLRGENEMLSVAWLPHQPSHTFDDVSTPVFDRALVIVIPSHILESVWFPLPSVSNGSGLPGCGPDLEPDRMVQSGLLPGKQ